MLFSPMTLGELELPNRLVMAPLTRVRSGKEGIPGPLLVEHYRQRASLGLIVSEGTYPSRAGRGFPGQPGLVTEEQLQGWSEVTAAVHAEGGRIFAQVMHAGRVTHEDTNGGHEVVAPSAIAIDGVTRTYEGKKPFPVPRALSTDGTAEHRPGIRHRVPQRDRVPGSTASSCTPPTATCCTNSWHRPPTSARTSTAARPRTVHASSLK